MSPDVYDIQISDENLNSYVLLRLAWLAVNRLAENRLARVGVTAETLTILWGIRDYSGKLSPMDLARLSHRDKQTISSLLNRMEKAGLIAKAPRRKGQPSTKLEITTKGKHICDAALPVFKSFIEDLFSSLSTEQKDQFQKLTRALRNTALEQLRCEISPPSGTIVPRVFPIKW
ncbi:MAG: MarR family transcriptional regulator [Chloroflexi bacterium]|nr:MarR family transcriptional regulator [Chloroflexota bacterium]